MDNYKEGIDYIEDDYNPIVTSGGHHATAVASILCGKDNDNGIIGVAPNIDLYVARIYEDKNDRGSISDLEDAILWACAKEVDIISMNAQFYGTSYSLEFVCYCAYLQGRVLVAAAGNKHGTYGYKVSCPAVYEHVIAVGAADHDGTHYYRADFSCYGSTLDFLAPGKDIMAAYGTIIKYMEFSGTCAASPFVSGVCALLLSDNPNLSPLQVKNNLIYSCLDLEAPGKDAETGWGLVNAYVPYFYDDWTNPTVQITSPQNNQEVRGTVTITANANDEHTVSKIRCKIDSNYWLEDDLNGENGWSFTWYTPTFSEGYYTITCIAYDWLGNTNQDQITVKLKKIGGGSGECPNLLVWNGKEFIDEGVLPIHNEEGNDMILYHDLDTTPGIIRKHFVNLKLAEIGEGYEFSQSFINQVKLFALNTKGEWVQCPLVIAIHTRYKNVKRDLRFKDDKRIETLKGDEINLIFFASSPMEYLNYKFMVIGHNMHKF